MLCKHEVAGSNPTISTPETVLQDALRDFFLLMELAIFANDT